MFTPTLKQASAAMEQTKQTSAAMNTSLQGHFNNSNKVVGEHSKIHKRLAKDIDSTGKAFNSLAGFTILGSAALLGYVQTAVKANMEMEKTIAQVSALNGVNGMTKQGMSDINDEVRKVGRDLHAVYGDVAKAYLKARENGISMADTQNFVISSIKISKAAHADLAKTTEDLTNIQKAYYLTQQDMVSIQDQLIATQQLASNPLEKMIPALSELSSKSFQAGASFVELSSGISYMTGTVHAKLETAQKSMQSFYGAITGENKLAIKALDEAGLSVEQLKQSMKDNGQIETIHMIAKALEGNNSAMRAVFGTAEGIAMAKKTLDDTELASMKEKEEYIKNANGLMGTYLQTLKGTDAAKLSKATTDFKNAISDAAVGLAPFVTNVINGISEMVNYWNGLSSTTRGTILEIVKDLALFVGGFKLLATVGGKVFGTISKGIKTFKKIKEVSKTVISVAQSFKVVQKAITGVKMAFNLLKIAFMSNPIGLAITVIISLFILLYTYCDGFRELVDSVVTAVIGYFSDFGANLQATMDSASVYIDSVWNGIGETFSGIWEGMKNTARNAVNYIIDCINGISFTAPDWVPVIGGQGWSPNLSHLANGTENWQGGIVNINEEGGEIVDLPRGTRVIPHDVSMEMAKNGGVSISIPKLADQIIVRQDSDIDKIADALTFRLKQYAINRM